MRKVPTDAELDRLVSVARERPPMTPAEEREQKVGFVWGQVTDAFKGRPPTIRQVRQDLNIETPTE